MAGQNQPVPRISEAEWVVMRFLWAKSPATAREIVTSLDLQTRWNAKTILTLINRLVAKGAVGFTKEARNHRYYPKLTERECVRVETRSFLDRVFGGSVQPMLAQFVREADLSERDVTELRRILDETRPKDAAEGSQPRKAKP
jgi:BlaI family transcriptional regulator, penicillinase repressor